MLQKTISHFRTGSIVNNSIATLLVKGSSIGSRLVALFLLARSLSATDYGMVAYILSLVEIARFVADFGMDLFAVRTFAITKDEAQRMSFANSLLSAKTLLSIAVYILIMLMFRLQSDSIQIDIAYALSFLVITTLFINLSLDYFQAQLRMIEIVPEALTCNIIGVVAISLSIWLKYDILVSILLLPLTELMVALLLLRKLRMNLPVTFSRESIASVPRLARECVPLAITGILVMLYSRIDVVILKALTNLEVVGTYSFAFRFSEPFALIGSTIGASIYSRLSLTISEGHSEPVPVIWKYVKAMAAYGIICCAFLWLAGPPLVRLFPANYAASIPVMQFLGVALIFRVINMCLSSAIMAYGKYSRITVIAIANLVIITIITLVTGKTMGAMGAVLAILIGETVNTIMQSLTLKKLIGKPTLLPLTKTT